MFEILVKFFNIVLYQPLFNFLILLYEYLPGHDFGIAVIVLTVLIRIIFYPLGVQAIKSQKTLSELQPKIKELQEKFKDNKEKQARVMMELYQKEKINPLSGCLPLLIQLPILIAIFQIFRRGVQEQLPSMLYNFISHPGQIDPTFLGTIDLSKSFIVKNGQVEYYWPVLILAVLAGIFQFWQSKMITPKTKPVQKTIPGFSQILQKQMLYFFPMFTILIICSLPAAIGLYWLVSTMFLIIQQYTIIKPGKKTTDFNR